MIGVYGGTFDPVHYGHLRTALEVKEQFDLQEIRLLPCSQPPHRQQPAVPAGKRLEMLQLAIAERSGMVIDTRELQRSGPSYMVDTLQSIRQEIDAIPLLLFIGTDAFTHLSDWHQWQSLFDFAHVVVITRPGSAKQVLNSFFAKREVKSQLALQQRSEGLLFFQAVTQLDISATAIRQIIAEKRNPGFLLPDDVIRYINKHRLYQQTG